MKPTHHHPLVRDAAWSAGVVLLGAGRGERLGHGPKALIDLGGQPLLLHALEAVAAHETVTSAVVTAPDGSRETFERVTAPGTPANFKITVERDLVVSRAVHAHAESFLQG